MANNWEISIPVDGWTPDTSNGPERQEIQGALVMSFDDTTDETTDSPEFKVPAAHTGTGTLKLDIDYFATGTSGSAGFEAALQCVTAGDSFDRDAGTSFAAVNAGDGTVPATAGHPQTITITLTTDDSMTADDAAIVRLNRNVGVASNVTGDVHVTAVRIREES